jgi:hypothetical protein
MGSLGITPFAVISFLSSKYLLLPSIVVRVARSSREVVNETLVYHDFGIGKLSLMVQA